MADKRRKIIDKLFISDRVAKEFKLFCKSNPDYTAVKKPLSSLGYVARLNWAEYRRKSLRDVPTPKGTKPPLRRSSNDACNWRKMTAREDASELVEKLAKYDVVSFDIFDTAIFRKVDKPDDVFSILAAEMDFPDYRAVRKSAESRARRRYKKETGTRELTLEEIYDVLEQDYGIDRKWQNREERLEVALSVPNPYILQIYQDLMSRGVTVVFTTDMYLPRRVLEKMLNKCGYMSYDLLLISNEEKLNKGSGDLQLRLTEFYAGKTIVHIGDNRRSDYEKSLEAGIAAVHNPDARLGDPNNRGVSGDVAGSFYRALINNNLNSGTWDKGISYTHGYRIGGILVAGYCQFINSIAKQYDIEKVLFCARDCKIIYEAYNKYFKNIENVYIEISRYAILSVTSDRYYYDLINRSILREAKKRRNTATLAQILEDTGFGYLIPLLEVADIDKFLFPCSLKEEKFEDFLYSVKEVVIEHNRDAIAVAKRYFSEAIGDAKRILIVDVGWTGTCVAALSYFISSALSLDQVECFGSLLCTSKNEAVAEAVGVGKTFGYLCSPYENRDILSFFMPNRKMSTEESDVLHMPLEYLFTSTDASLISYAKDEGEDVRFIRTHHAPRNAESILDTQQGILDFCRDYSDYSSCTWREFTIGAYLASQPLRFAIEDRAYLKEVYGSYLYDATSPLYGSRQNEVLFKELLVDCGSAIAANNSALLKESRGNLLFITPEMTYTGTPRSMLRICKIAREAGYAVDVWSQRSGAFAQEYKSAGFNVSVVSPSDLANNRIKRLLSSYDLVICNTIATDAYVRACDGVTSVAWYIREATNIPDFCNGNDARMRTLQGCDRIVCVSDYAAEALRQFTAMPIRVVKNAVEDLSEFASSSYLPGSKEKITFTQLGTMEYRKGYDLCLAAYLALPSYYQERVVMNFAGGFINSGTSYCSYIFSIIDSIDNINYLGILDDVSKKVDVLSSSDVVMVASRDESCSLVALEGAMLSRALIVTDHVGAKYMVDENNGWIVPSGDVEALKKAIIEAVDASGYLAEMGIRSRNAYEMNASMQVHSKEILQLIRDSIQKGVYRSRNEETREVSSDLLADYESSSCGIVVSLTSHPGRIKSVSKTIKTLLNQSLPAKEIVLWLSVAQFPSKEADLPIELVDLTDRGLTLRWVKEDLGPHKKYLYAMRENKTDPIVIVDDDVEYGPDLLLELYRSYQENPHSISCMRANLMLFKPDGTLRDYDDWVYEYKAKRGYPTYQLLPTGVGGVLYPPGSIPEFALNADAIERTCRFTDDLWLKFAAVQNGYPAVLPKRIVPYSEIPGTQAVALWSMNANRGRNDASLRQIITEYEAMGYPVNALLQRMRCVGDEGQWVGPEEIGYDQIERVV